MRYLLYYHAEFRSRYVLREEALRDVRSGAAILDRTVLEDDYTVRTIKRPEEREFYWDYVELQASSCRELADNIRRGGSGI